MRPAFSILYGRKKEGGTGFRRSRNPVPPSFFYLLLSGMAPLTRQDKLF